jgi:hypothetical protein
MPGLAALRGGAARIAVGYQDDPAGGQITYTTADPVLVIALHPCFDGPGRPARLAATAAAGPVARSRPAMARTGV